MVMDKYNRFSNWIVHCVNVLRPHLMEVNMEYHLEYKDGMKWKRWGYSTSDLFEIKQKIDYAKRAVGSGIKLRYVAVPKNSYQILEGRGAYSLF